MRFNELRRGIEGISKRMLTITLRGFERDGLVTQTMYPSTPPRVDYELTELRETLTEPVMAFVNWANKSQEAIALAHRQFDAKEEAEDVVVKGIV